MKVAVGAMTKENPTIFGSRAFWAEDGKMVCKEPGGKILRGPLALKQYRRCQKKVAHQASVKVARREADYESQVKREQETGVLRPKGRGGIVLPNVNDLAMVDRTRKR